MKPIAILTMVYDDDIYLRIWLAYWERFVPRSNLYVLIHANHEHYEEMARGCNTIRIARPPVHADLETHRWRMLSSLGAWNDLRAIGEARRPSIDSASSNNRPGRVLLQWWCTITTHLLLL